MSTDPPHITPSVLSSSLIPRSPLSSSSFIPRTPHYITGHYVAPSTFLSDSLYSLSLDALTKGCNDVLLTYSSLFLIGYRVDYPQRDWWYGCGGRLRPGESLQSSASRLLSRELGLPLSPQSLIPRLATVGHYSYAWEMRAQPPLGNGTADIAVVTSLEVTEEEKAAVDSGRGGERGERRWVTANQILTGTFHPALKRGIRDWMAWKAFRQLEEAVREMEVEVQERGKEEGEAVSDVVVKAKAFVTLMCEAREGEEKPIFVAENYSPEHSEEAAKRQPLTKPPH